MARRFGTVATFYTSAVIDGVIPANHPAAHSGAARRARGGRRTHRRSDPADPHRAADGPRRRHPCPHAGRPRSGDHPPDQPARPRRTFCTTGLVAAISIRDMQYAMRHVDTRTTMRYDMAKANLDRHAAHAVAAYLAGMSTG